MLQQRLKNLSDMILFILYLAIILSALMVVYQKHQSRQLLATLQQTEKLQDHYHVQYSQLLLEQGVWARQQRIEKIAQQKLNMIAPRPADVVILHLVNDD